MPEPEQRRHAVSIVNLDGYTPPSAVIADVGLPNGGTASAIILAGQTSSVSIPCVPEPKSQDNFSPGQPWTWTALETIEYSTHVLKVKLFFQHLINNVKTHPNLCPVVGCLYLKHENKDKNLITSFPINCSIFLSTDFRRVHVYCTQ
jgi:hypothetical protein